MVDLLAQGLEFWVVAEPEVGVGTTADVVDGGTVETRRVQEAAPGSYEGVSQGGRGRAAFDGDLDRKSVV